MSSLSRIKVGSWLMIGVGMILIQIVLGGITRLTGSGLSITEWNLIMGTIPPMNKQEWNEAFDQYKQFPQYRIMNSEMDLAGFKKIFFWEYVHRLWARLFIPAFIFPLIYFLWKKMIPKKLLIQLAIVFVLGGLQGLVGWIMVASGLVDQPWVNPVKLSIHLILALVLLCYLFWIALQVFDMQKESKGIQPFRKFSLIILVLLFLQIFYGGLMAGNHAALFYPTFPKIGSQWIPEGLLQQSPWLSNFFSNTGMIQLVHRTLGFVIAALIVIYYFRIRTKTTTLLFRQVLMAFPVLVIVQILLGISTLLNSLGSIPLTLAALHQFCAVLLLLNTVFLLYQTVGAEKNKEHIMSLNTAVSA